MPKIVRGWLLDVYPSTVGQMNVWLISEDGERIKLIDFFKPKFYVSTKKGTITELHRLVSQLNLPVNSCRFIRKIAEPKSSLDQWF